MLDLLQQIGRIGVFDWDLATGVAEYSEQYLLIHGLASTTKSEIFSDWMKRVHPEDLARILPHMQDFSGNAPPEIQYRVVRPNDGEVRWIVERRKIVRDAGDNPVRIIGVQRDNTAERNATLALTESERRLSLALQAADIGIWEWDIDRDVMNYTRIAREISGLDPDKPLRIQNISNTVHPEDLPRTSAMMQRALDPAIQEKLPYEYRIVLPDGAIRWILAHGEAVFEKREGKLIATRYVGTIQDITAQKKAADAERQQLQRLRLALEAGKMAAWELDIATDTLTRSPELNRVLGFPEGAELTREEIQRGYLAGERERVQAVGRAAVEAGERFFEVEFRYRPPGGELRWLLLRCEVVNDAQGRPMRAVGVVADVTARKMAEEELGRTTSTLNASIDNAPVGFSFFDQNHRYVRVNSAIARLNGLPAADHIGRSLAEVVPEIASAIAQQLDHVFQTGQAIESYEVNDDRAGALRSWLTSFFPVFDSAGDVQFVGVTRIDISELKRAEARVRELNDSLERRVAEALADKRRLTEVIDRTDVFVQVADRDFNWLAINEAASIEFARLFGVPRPKVGDNMLNALAHLPDQQAAVRAVWSRAIGGEEFLETQEFGDAPQNRRHYEMRFRTLRDPDGTAVGAYQFVYDVTERIREQAKLAKAEAALQQAQKMDALGRLSGGIAHDFNNLLQSVAGSFDLIRRKPGNAERVARLAEAGMHAADRGAKLTKQLLAFSRAQKIEARPLHVPQLVHGMREMLERTLGPMITVAFNLDEACEPVLIDATQLEMALLNLAINARDAMNNGGRLSIAALPRRVERQDGELEPGSYVELSVADDGAGMSPDVAAHAFDPFFTTKDIGKGTGLGLSQVYGIARQTGGSARIESRVGAGTTVRLFLRCTSDPLAPLDIARTSVPAQSLAKNILLVDDDADVRRFLQEALASFGHSVETAEDGRGALKALGRARPDLMVLDFAMPGMSGAEVCRAARELRPGLPIILISGYAEKAAIEELANTRVVLLGKPFSLDELAETIERVSKG